MVVGEKTSEVDDKSGVWEITALDGWLFCVWEALEDAVEVEFKVRVDVGVNIGVRLGLGVRDGVK